MVPSPSRQPWIIWTVAIGIHKVFYKNKPTSDVGIWGIYNTKAHLTLSRCGGGSKSCVLEFSWHPRSDKSIQQRTSEAWLFFNMFCWGGGGAGKTTCRAGFRFSQPFLVVQAGSHFSMMVVTEENGGGVGYKVLRLEMTANHFIIHKFLHRSLGSVWVMPSLTSRLPWWADSLALTYTTAILLLVTCDALSVVLIKGSPSLHQDSWNCCFHQKRHSQYNLIQITINFSPSIPNCDFEIVYSYRSGYQKSGLMKFILVCLLRSYTDHTGDKNICT